MITSCIYIQTIDFLSTALSALNLKKLNKTQLRISYLMKRGIKMLVVLHRTSYTYLTDEFLKQVIEDWLKM